MAAVEVPIVHGGDRDGLRLLDEDEQRSLEEIVPLSPPHRPKSLAPARMVAELLPDVPVFGCFDTSGLSTGDRVIGSETARTRVLVVKAGEDVEIAHQVCLARLAV